MRYTKQTIIKAKGLFCVLIFTILPVFTSCKTPENEVKEFTAFFTVEGSEISPDNELMDEIAKVTGAKCRETWLTGLTKEEAINQILAKGDLPDFIQGGHELYQANALIPLDDYIEKYPNLKTYLSEKQWDSLRQSDGHIYWIPQFNIAHVPSKELTHGQEAFWIQTRVLKWAGYPDVNTVEEYFKLIEDYINAHPDEGDIGFSILCDGWRGFCLENPPQFLDGYPNDGSCIVDTDTMTVKDYNTTDTAREYYRILNSAYKKGLVDEESFTSTYSEYMTKLGTGKVLGMVDQWWQFYYPLMDYFMTTEGGINYVPLPITISKDVPNQWHTATGAILDVSDGLSITVDCKEPDAAAKFVNDLLSEEVMKLRYWGVEGVDYSVDENGLFYMTDKQDDMTKREEYVVYRRCQYSYFPRIEGLSSDGKNALMSEQQPTVFFDDLPEDVKETFKAYGCETYVDMLGSNELPGPWYPMYSYSDSMGMDTDEGYVWNSMKELKARWLPMVIMSDDFEASWEQYMTEYNALHPEIFFDAMQIELMRRVENGYD